MIAEVWIALSTAARDAVATRLQWDEETQGEYSGPVTDTEYRIFNRMVNFGTVSKMFRAGTFGGKTWHLFQCVFPEGSTKIQQALDFLEANRPNNFEVVGAWWFDGRQIGTQWELDQDGNRTGNTTGTPLYPVPTTQLLKLMPTIKQYDENGDLISETEPTVPTDVHVIQGQSPRRF